MIYLKTRGSLLLTALLLVACGKSGLSTSKAECSSENTQASLQNAIKDSYEKYVKSQDDLDTSKARATFAQIKVNIDNVRTTKEDPNSTKKFCAGTIKLSIPAELLASLENTVETANKGRFKDVVKPFGLDADANVFSKDIEYSVQPSDDGKSLFTDLDNGKAIVGFLGTLTSIDQMKGKVEAAAAIKPAGSTNAFDAMSSSNSVTSSTQKQDSEASIRASKRKAFVYAPPSNVRVTPDGQQLCAITQRTNINIYDYAGSTYDGSREVKWYYTDACGSMGVIAYSQFR
jgi:hypothetical protein